jgi:hypothetical protein
MRKRAIELESDLKRWYSKYSKIEEQVERRYLNNDRNEELDDK